MKDFITTIASVLILMMFVMQFAANQAAYTRIMSAEYAVRELRLISENQGMISSESIAELRKSLADILECGQEEICILPSGADYDAPNEGNQPLSVNLEVKMPVYGVIGPARALGIGPEQNVREHVSRSIIMLPPAPEPEEKEPEEQQ
ncbi:MAG: hypothetical protein IIX87_03880 [Firmicutes bacterium]|nr:hypothetical protein [Bacillota bacterium]